MTDASFTGTIPDFESLIEDTVEDVVENNVERAIERALDNLDIGDYLSDINLHQYIDVDSLLYESGALDDLVTSDGAWDVAREVVSEYGSSDGNDIHALNEMLDTVSKGNDCSDGNSFRDAVKAIVNAQILSGGQAPSDGTIMTLKTPPGATEREIQAILTRRASYFSALMSRLGDVFPFYPGSAILPHEWDATPDTTSREAFLEGNKKTISNQRDVLYTDVSNNLDDNILINRLHYEKMQRQMKLFGQVSVEAMSLVMLLRTLHDGHNGATAVENGRSAKAVAEACLEAFSSPPTQTINQGETIE